jgi:hypothetical protein
MVNLTPAGLLYKTDRVRYHPRQRLDGWMEVIFRHVNQFRDILHLEKPSNGYQQNYLKNLPHGEKVQSTAATAMPPVAA